MSRRQVPPTRYTVRKGLVWICGRKKQQQGFGNPQHGVKITVEINVDNLKFYAIYGSVLHRFKVPVILHELIMKYKQEEQITIYNLNACKLAI